MLRMCTADSSCSGRSARTWAAVITVAYVTMTTDSSVALPSNWTNALFEGGDGDSGDVWPTDDYSDSAYAKHYKVKWDIIQYVTPTFFALGIIGNALAFAVFARRLHRLVISGVPKRLEQCATCGLIFLTASDFLVCASGLPSAFASIEPFAPADDLADVVRLRYVTVKTALINLWMFTSTWVTCLLCVQRCLGVCYPVRFSSVVSLRRTALVNCAIVFVAIIVNAPGFRRFTLTCVDELDDGTQVEGDGGGGSISAVMCYIIPSNVFAKRSVYVAYYVTWSVLGGVVPVVIMAVCNTKLLATVRRKTLTSYRSSLSSSSSVSREASIRRADRRRNRAQQTTFLLVLITTVYLFLVTPSLVVNVSVLLLHGTTESAYAGYQMALVLLNLAQVVNFSTSFVVCIAFSSSFRAHFVRMFWRRTRSQLANRRYSPPPKASPRDLIKSVE